MSQNAQVRAGDGPNVGDLLQSYRETLSQLGHWTDQCSVSFDDRRNYWPGKSSSLRKSGSDALPWEGASDCESLVISERIQAYVSMCMFALARANIRAYPVEVSDAAAARVVSSFIKYMRDSYIPHFSREMELTANLLFEQGLGVTYVGWERKDMTQLQVFDIEQIAAQAPEMAEMLMNESYDDELVEMLLTQWPKLKKREAKKALKKLRKEGYAELPVYVRSIDRPMVQALATDVDIFFPHYCTDPQQAPFVHRRVLMTPTELLSKVSTEEWDEKWVDHVIEKLRGTHTSDIEAKDSAAFLGQFDENSDFVEIIYTYQRLMKDGAEGIYCTVWHQSHTGNNAHAKHTLLEGLSDYPFIVTELHRDSKRLYDTRSMVDLLRGTQWQVKAERDSRIDRSSLATLPASKGPVGRPKPEFRPGGHVTERRAGEYGWVDPPPADPGSIEIESTLLAQADRMVGLASPELDPDAQMKRAFYLDKFLAHISGVLSAAFSAFNRYGPAQLFFRISGIPEPQQFEKMDPNHEMDLHVSWDAQNHDPETVEKKLTQMLQLVQYDRTGKIDISKMLDFAAAAIDPVLADTVLQAEEQGTAKAARDVAEDLSMIYAGLEIGARPSGHQIAMQIGQQYMQQPDVAERAQNDEAFAARLQKYFGQIQHQLQQQQNAETGKLGTESADLQGIQQAG